jgi:hypothetical protein
MDGVNGEMKTLQIWLLTMAFCVHVVNNTNYFGWDYKTCYSMCAKGFTF